MMTIRSALTTAAVIAALVLGGAAPIQAAVPAPTPTAASAAPPEQEIDPAAPAHPEDEHAPMDVPEVVPWEDGTELSEPSPRARAAAPAWNLPFEAGAQWSSGGPHADSDGTARGALDFTPGSSPNKRVVAIASGRVYQLMCPNGWFLGVDHGNGWKSEYYHLTNAQSGLIGSWIPTGAYLGEAGNTLPCGGSSNGPHVHLSILYGAVPQPGPGVLRPYHPVSGMQFGNYVITAGSSTFSGTWRTLSGATVITNWGCCLLSTTAVPRPFASAPTPVISGGANVGGTLTATLGSWSPAPDLAAQWRRNGAPISGATATSYVVTKQDRGASLTLTVDARRDDTFAASRTSNAVVIPTPVIRIAGADRYETSAAISAAAFGPGVPVAYLATGERFPDALSGAAAAGASGGPVLLVSRDTIPAAVATELRRLAPKRIVVVGGTDAISDAVRSQANGFTTGAVDRRAGADRYATSALVSAASFPARVSVAYLATGADFADALSAAAVAGATKAPVLLTERDALSPAVAAELQRLAPARIVVLGGESRVAASVVTEAAAYTTGGVTRIAGSDRFETAALIASTHTTPPVDQVYLARGDDFADALSGAAAAAATESRVLLTHSWGLTVVTAQSINTLQTGRVMVLGGAASITPETARVAGTYAR